MSSWGSWSKISKLQQVGDFSFFGYKSSLLVSKVSFNYVYTFTVHRYCIHKPIHIIKFFTNILMGFKIWCQVSKFDVKLGVAEHYFWNYNIHVTFQIFGSKLVIFFPIIGSVLKNHPFFLKITGTFLSCKIEKSLVPNLSPFFVFYWIHPFFLSKHVDN